MGGDQGHNGRSGSPGDAIKIRAYVRELSDRQLIEEQSLENGVRENLTWIEQAMWAVQLKSAGLSHRAMCPILGSFKKRQYRICFE
ncbi:MAG: hypothetical protein ACJLUP_14440 [Agrobacterium tumefaciens]